MTSVDFHTHVVPPSLPDWQARFGAGPWPRLVPEDDGTATMMLGDAVFMRLDDRFWSVERRLVDMDRLGIGVQVLSPIPALACYRADAAANREIARFLNEHVAAIAARRPDRFAAMATVPLQDPVAAIAELRHARNELRIAAVQIGTCPAGRDLDDPSLFAFFEACRDLGMAVFIHPIEPVVGRERMADFYLPNIVGNPLESALAVSRLICGGVLERLPELRLCVAHAGGALPAILGRLDKGFAVRPELRQRISRPPSDYARMIYVDALSFDAGALALAIEKHGSRHVLLGSDYPFLLGDADPLGSLEKQNLEAEIVQAIAGRNFYEFLMPQQEAAAS